MTAIPFDAVLFDCDGVLVDSEPITNRVLTQMLGELGWHITPEACMQIFVGKAVRDEIALIESHTGVRIDDAWQQEFRQRRNTALEKDLIEVNGAPAAVRQLHKLLGGRIAVASGADLHKVQLQLQKTGMAECFENRIFSGQDLPRSKPYPDVYLAAAKALGVDASRCAVVEDTATGARAGLAAGAVVFGYCPGGAGHDSAEALREAGVQHLFASMAALPDMLAQWQPEAMARSTRHGLV